MRRLALIALLGASIVSACATVEALGRARASTCQGKASACPAGLAICAADGSAECVGTPELPAPPAPEAQAITLECPHGSRARYDVTTGAMACVR